MQPPNLGFSDPSTEEMDPSQQGGQDSLQAPPSFRDRVLEIAGQVNQAAEQHELEDTHSEIFGTKDKPKPLIGRDQEVEQILSKYPKDHPAATQMRDSYKVSARREDQWTKLRKRGKEILENEPEGVHQITKNPVARKLLQITLGQMGTAESIPFLGDVTKGWNDVVEKTADWAVDRWNKERSFFPRGTSPEGDLPDLEPEEMDEAVREGAREAILGPMQPKNWFEKAGQSTLHGTGAMAAFLSFKLPLIKMGGQATEKVVEMGLNKVAPALSRKLGESVVGKGLTEAFGSGVTYATLHGRLSPEDENYLQKHPEDEMAVRVLDFGSKIAGWMAFEAMGAVPKMLGRQPGFAVQQTLAGGGMALSQETEALLKDAMTPNDRAEMLSITGRLYSGQLTGEELEDRLTQLFGGVAPFAALGIVQQAAAGGRLPENIRTEITDHAERRVLETLYKENPTLAFHWLTRRNQRDLEPKTPEGVAASLSKETAETISAELGAVEAAKPPAGESLGSAERVPVKEPEAPRITQEKGAAPPVPPKKIEKVPEKIPPTPKEEAIPTEAEPPYQKRLFRGEGATREEVYGKENVEAGRAHPFFGKASYFAETEKEAGRYGKKITEEEVELRNPLVIDSDKGFVDLLYKAKASVLSSRTTEFYKEPQESLAATGRLQKYIRSLGHDGVIVRVPGVETDLNERGESAKQLIETFGHSQVVRFPEKKGITVTGLGAPGEKIPEKAPEVKEPKKTPPEPIPEAKPAELSSEQWQKTLEREERTKERVNKTQIIQEVEKLFDVPVRGKATHPFRGKAGHYEVKPEMIRLRTGDELEVLAHEVTHHVDKMISGTVGKNWFPELAKGNKVDAKAIAKELRGLDYDQKARRQYEGFAEFMRHKLTGTGIDAQKAPTFSKYFSEFLQKPENERVRQGLDRVYSMYKTWSEQGAENRILQQIDFRGEHTKKLSIKERAEKAKNWWLNKWVDDLTTIRQIEQKVRGVKSLTDVRPTRSAYKLARAYQQEAGAMANAMVKEGQINERFEIVGPSLEKILEPIPKEDLRRFLAYWVSKRADVYHKRGKESGFERKDIDFFLERAKNPTWDKAVDEITEWSRGPLRMLQRAGGLSEAEFEAIEKLNPIYATFKRIFRDEVDRFQASAGGGMLPKGKGIYSIRGSGKAIQNPVEAIIESVRTMIQRANKVRVASLVADWSKVSGMGKHIVEVPAPKEATSFKAEQILKDLQKAGVDTDQINPETMLTVFQNSAQYKGKDNIYSFYKNGKRRWYEVSPELSEALDGVGDVGLNTVQKILGAPARVLRAGATELNPAFQLYRNLMRDLPTYLITSQQRAPMVWDPALGLYKYLTAEPGSPAWRFKQGLSVSGQIGNDRADLMAAYDALALNKSLKGRALLVAKHPVDSLRRLLSFWEPSLRIMESTRLFEQLKKKHPSWSEEDLFIEALNAGKDVTVNFSRAGTYGRQLNRVDAFFNAGMQGASKVYRAFEDAPLRTTVRGIAYLTIPALYFWYKNKDKDWYGRLDPEYKHGNIFAQADEKGEQIVRIGLPFELGTIFASLPTIYAEATYHDRKEEWDALMSEISKNIPDPTPTALGPMIDVARNKDFLGRPIEAEGLKRRPIEDRSYPGTANAAKAMSEALRSTGLPFFQLSPVETEYLLNQYFGGLPRKVGALSNLKEPQDLPVVGPLLLRRPENPSRQLKNFYELKKDLEQRRQVKRVTPREKDRLKQLDALEDLISDRRKKIDQFYDKNDLDAMKRQYALMEKDLARYGFK